MKIENQDSFWIPKSLFQAASIRRIISTTLLALAVSVLPTPVIKGAHAESFDGCMSQCVFDLMNCINKISEEEGRCSSPRVDDLMCISRVTGELYEALKACAVPDPKSKNDDPWECILKAKDQYLTGLFDCAFRSRTFEDLANPFYRDPMLDPIFDCESTYQYCSGSPSVIDGRRSIYRWWDSNPCETHVWPRLGCYALPDAPPLPPERVTKDERCERVTDEILETSH